MRPLTSIFIALFFVVGFLLQADGQIFYQRIDNGEIPLDTTKWNW